MRLRLVIEDGVSDSYGLSADEMLARRVGQGQSSPTLRLYTYRSHVALVGRFQNVNNELHLAFCAQHGIAVNRRPTGGGAILMGSDQLGIALTVPGRAEDTYGRARDLMGRFATAAIEGLRSLGVTSSFRRKNDLEANGRKIAGLGLYRDVSGGLLFHASLLVDMDVALMLQVLNTPFEKISDKEIRTVEGRIETLRHALRRHVSMDEVRAMMTDACAVTFGLEIDRDSFTSDEKNDINELAATRYRSAEWIHQRVEVPDATGAAKIKTPGGLLDVSVSLAGDMIKAAYIRGDFFTSEAAVADLEARLRWHTTETCEISGTLREVYARHEADLSALPFDGIVNALSTAVQRAKMIHRKMENEPYGCFVNPGGAYA